jgi:hypothetical protein
MKKKAIIPIVILVAAALGYLVWKAWDRGPFPLRRHRRSHRGRCARPSRHPHRFL